MLTALFLVLAIVWLIALEGFFSGVEAAVISCDKVTIQHLAKKKDRAARRLLKMIAAPDKLVATTLLGTNLSVVINSVLATVFAEKHLGLAAPAVVTVVLGPLVFLFGELLPKIIFQQRANRFALTFSSPLRIAQVLLHPAVWLLEFIQSRVVGRGS